MASKKKKKKKKKPSGARRSTYATGKKIEEPAKKGPAAQRPGKPAGKAGQASSQKGSGKETGKPAATEQWNIVRKGTLEMKILQALLVLVAVATIIQYPLLMDNADRNYRQLQKEYPKELKKWEQKYKTSGERKKHESEKPLKPRKPTFNDFLITNAFIYLLQGAIFTFLGINIARRTDLRMPFLDSVFSGDGVKDLGDLAIYSLAGGAAALVPLLISTATGKYMGLPERSTVRFSTWKEALNYAGSGVQFQLMFVFVLMGALVWVFAKYRERIKLEPHYAAIAAASVLAFFYFYSSSSASGIKTAEGLLSALFITISLVWALGYLYWKKGLEYSLLAAVVAFGLYPFFAALIIK